MSKYFRTAFISALLATSLYSFPVFAQSPDEVNARIDRMEEQMRQMVGQIEELNHSIKMLQAQRPVELKKSGAADSLAAPDMPASQAKKLASGDSEPNQALPPQRVQAQASAGVEQIQSEPLSDESGVTADTKMYSTVIDANGNEKRVQVFKAPPPKALGQANNAASAPDDGGFQGQVLVPAGGGTAEADGGSAGVGVETVSLAPETPESLYEKSNESLLRRRFSDAEAGFSSFLSKYPTHALAGSAQYWLGETYYAQGNYNEAARNFLAAYKQFPKSRRAPDSLFKLGVSLNKLGQQEQACASLDAVSKEFPNAVDVKKRAQLEFKRDGC